jgi:hypothetical protein
MTKQQTIEMILEHAAPGTVQRELLVSKSPTYLDAILAQVIRLKYGATAANDPALIEKQRQVEAINLNRAFMGLLHQTIVDGKRLVDNEANRAVIQGWLQPGEEISHTWLKKVFAEQPALANQLSWEKNETLLEKRQQQEQALQHSRQVFADAARHFRTFGNSEANFLAAVRVLGESFTVADFEKAIQSGRLHGLAPSTDEQRQKWLQEENEKLATGNRYDPEIREISERRRTEETRTAQQIAFEYGLVAGFEKEVTHGPCQPLPQFFGGKPLDATFIQQSDTATLKTLLKRYGNAQVTARLRNIKRATALLDRGDGRGPKEVSYEFN